MKKILWILAVFTLLFSCSDDDSKPAADEIPANEKFLRKITYPDPSISYTFDYNADKTVRKITSSLTDDPFAQVFSFTYENGVIISVDRLRANNTIRTTFSYDANRRLTGVTTGNNYRPMTYYPADNSYVTTSPQGRPMKFYLTADGDVGRTVEQTQTGEFPIGLIFNPQKFGALYNSNAITLYLYLIEPIAIVVFGPQHSKRPVENISYVGNIPYVNTYDSQGFITEAKEDPSSAGITFEYMRL